tara:strand:- start:1378 stop:1953 length:576 start_codon:yes stop_codon:yes gene_type:complete
MQQVIYILLALFSLSDLQAQEAGHFVAEQDDFDAPGESAPPPSKEGTFTSPAALNDYIPTDPGQKSKILHQVSEKSPPQENTSGDLIEKKASGREENGMKSRQDMALGGQSPKIAYAPPQKKRKKKEDKKMLELKKLLKTRHHTAVQTASPLPKSVSYSNTLSHSSQNQTRSEKKAFVIDDTLGIEESFPK